MSESSLLEAISRMGTSTNQPVSIVFSEGKSHPIKSIPSRFEAKVHFYKKELFLMHNTLLASINEVLSKISTFSRSKRFVDDIRNAIKNISSRLEYLENTFDFNLKGYFEYSEKIKKEANITNEKVIDKINNNSTENSNIEKEDTELKDCLNNYFNNVKN